MNIYNSGLVHIKSLPCLRLVATSNTKAETTSSIDVILCQIAWLPFAQQINWLVSIRGQHWY